MNYEIKSNLQLSEGRLSFCSASTFPRQWSSRTLEKASQRVELDRSLYPQRLKCWPGKDTAIKQIPRVLETHYKKQSHSVCLNVRYYSVCPSRSNSRGWGIGLLKSNQTIIVLKARRVTASSCVACGEQLFYLDAPSTKPERAEKKGNQRE